MSRVPITHTDFGYIGGRTLEPLALHEQMRDWSTDDTRAHEPGGCAQDADFESVADVVLRGECWRPRDGSTMAAEHRHAAGQQADRRWPTNEHRRRDPRTVLQDEKNNHAREQDDEWASTRFEVDSNVH